MMCRNFYEFIDKYRNDAILNYRRCDLAIALRIPRFFICLDKEELCQMRIAQPRELPIQIGGVRGANLVKRKNGKTMAFALTVEGRQKKLSVCSKSRHGS